MQVSRRTLRLLWLTPTNGVHGMGSELEDAIEYESATLEKHVTPVPAIILDDVMGLGLYPQIEPDQSYSGEPPVRVLFDNIIP